MNNKIYGLIPLGGTASRMKNIPKFLLPCGIGLSLLDNAINILEKHNVFQIMAGVSNLNNLLLENNKNLNKIVVETKTMAETVFYLTKEIEKIDKNFKNILIMPDTHFVLKDEIKNMINMLDVYSIVVIVWKIKDYQVGKVGQCKLEDDKIIDVIDKDKNCTYPYFWGVIGWNSTMNQHIIPEWETIGDLIKIAIEMNIKVGCIISDGNYYDCGTYSEYFKMIKCEL